MRLGSQLPLSCAELCILGMILDTYICSYVHALGTESGNYMIAKYEVNKLSLSHFQKQDTWDGTKILLLKPHNSFGIQQQHLQVLLSASMMERPLN
jgi:hypothetical protein